MWLCGLRTRPSVCEDENLIPGFSQWVKDLAWLQGTAQVTDAAQIWRCSGCGLGLQLRPLARELPYAAGKDVKTKKKEKEVRLMVSRGGSWGWGEGIG